MVTSKAGDAIETQLIDRLTQLTLGTVEEINGIGIGRTQRVFKAFISLNDTTFDARETEGVERWVFDVCTVIKNRNTLPVFRLVLEHIIVADLHDGSPATSHPGMAGVNGRRQIGHNKTSDG